MLERDAESVARGTDPSPTGKEPVTKGEGEGGSTCEEGAFSRNWGQENRMLRESQGEVLKAQGDNHFGSPRTPSSGESSRLSWRDPSFLGEMTCGISG